MVDQADNSVPIQRLREAIAAAGFTNAGLIEATPESRSQLEEALAAEGSAPEDSAQDPATAALALLESDPALAPFLNGTVKRPKPKDFASLPEVLTMTTAALIVLSAYVEVERDKQGRWRFHFIVKPQTDKMKTAMFALIRSLVGNLPTR